MNYPYDIDTTRGFIFSWDMHGIESIIDVNEYIEADIDKTYDTLRGVKGTKKSIDGVVHNLILRARYNTHRHYEIYFITCDKEMSTDYWTEMWKDNPQFVADLIRERGQKIFSDRMQQDKILIR